MRILYCSAKKKLQREEGPSVHIVQVCNHLAGRGNNVLLLVDRNEWEVSQSGLKVVSFPQAIHYLPRRFRAIVQRYLALGVAKIFRPDVLYQRDRIGDVLPLWLSEKYPIPLVIEVNGWYPGDIAERKGPVAYTEAVEQLRPRYEHAAAIITSSPGLRDLVCSTFKVSPERVIHINNGVDLARFSQSSPSEVNCSGTWVAGMVGGNHPHIDIDSILQAAALLSARGAVLEIHLFVYGARSCEVERKVRAMGIGNIVKIFPPIAHSLVPRVLSGFRVCLAIYKKSVLEKHKSIEASMKLWEYWASQRPVIVTDLPGTYSYAHHLEQRFLAVPPEDPQALANAIETLYRNPELARMLAINGYSYVQKGHSWADVAARIEAVLRSVLEQ
ncbi:MAG: glycosyltransferase [Anaerolineae bacterium]|nr:glycosyltransferase [Anaerolineae bacterium]